MFVYWILFPLLFGATMVGLGLGLRRLSMPFTPALLLPAGYGVAVVVASMFTYYGATAKLTGPILIVLAVGGFVAEFGTIRAALRGGALQRHWPWIVASVAGFLVFGASVIAIGRPSYTGYNQIVDISPQMSWAWYLGEHGRDALTSSSTPRSFVNNTRSTGYPAGPQALLGTFPTTFGMNIPWSYQPYLAMVAASIVSAAYAIIRQATSHRSFAAVGAFVAGQASALIGYALIGGIKELTAVLALLTTAAFIQSTATPGVKAWRAVLPFTVGMAATFTIFSLTMLPWLGILAAGALLIIWSRVSLRDALVRGGIAIGVFVFVTLSTSIPSKDSFAFADLMQKEVGNLAHPVSIWATTGVWITNDHRFELTGPARTISIIIGVVVIVLAVIGLFTALRRGAPGLAVLMAASLIGLVILLARMGPWVDFKGMVLTAPVVLIAAVIGLSALLSQRRNALFWTAWAGLAGLLAVSLYSDALRYGSAQLAPNERLSELRSINERYAGAKATLIPDWDENGGFELRDVGGTQAFNWPFVASETFTAENPGFNTAMATQWDLDQLSAPWVNGFELIVMRRSPGQSRPGRQFELAEQGRFFDVWKRTKAPATVAHLPLTGIGDPSEQTKCQEFVDKLEDNATVTIAPATPVAPVAQFAQENVSKGLEVSVGNAVLTKGNSGVAKGLVDLGTNAGLFEVYATDLSRRHNSVTVGGKTLDIEVDPSAAARGQYLGSVPLPNGVQPVTVKLGGTTLSPGSSKKANIGAWTGTITFVPSDTLHPALMSGPAGTMKCPTSVDWVETP